MRTLHLTMGGMAAFAMFAAIPQVRAAKAEFVRETVAAVEARDNCGKTEIFDVPRPFAATDDTAALLTIKCARGGDGVLYWRSEGMKDFASNCGDRFSIIGDGQFHTYELRPNWQVKDRIVKLRIDFPYDRKDPGRKVDVALKSAVFERRGVAPFDAKDADGVLFRMKSGKLDFLSLNWNATAGTAAPVPFYMGFTSIPDGRTHTYWFDLKNTRERITFGKPHWFGRIGGFCFRANLKHEEFIPDGVEFVKGTPDLPADPVIRQVFPEDAIPRAGRPLPIEIVVRNYGTRPAEGVRFKLDGLPDGVRPIDGRELAPGGSVAPSAGYDYIRDDYMPHGLPNERRYRITLSDPGRPMEFTARLSLTAANGAHSEKDFSVKVLPSLNMAPCAYPPEPKPVDTGDIEIGAFLFPGWKRHQWYPAWDSMPERKPVLGWYDDSSPEVRDWQIKWLVENGISYVFVDWYWEPEKGPNPNNYWIEGFGKARYRKYLKYAALWCNEGAYRHSVKDQEMVTRHWISHFFADPQYLRIDGRPVVGMWALNMDKSMGKDGAKTLIAISQKIAREAGYPGIYFVSIQGAQEDPSSRRHLKDVGVSASFEYYYNTRWTPHWPGLVDGLMDYSAVVDSSFEHWRTLHEGCDLPFFPSLSTATDRRPWTGDRGWGIVNKTPAKFAKICREAKRFSAETGVKRLLLGPLDEWCEGEIAYPNAEHGFGMLEQVRETFAVKPEGGFPPNYAPQDVGLGPYTKAAAEIVGDTVSAEAQWDIFGSFGKARGTADVVSDGFRFEGDGYRVETRVKTDGNGVSLRKTVLKNVSDGPIEANCLLDRFVFDGGEYEAYTQVNTWQNESRGAWQPLNTGVEVRGPGICSARGAAPMLALWNVQSGRGKVFHLLANSGWEMHALRFARGGEKTGVAVEVGVDGRHLRHVLAPGEEVALPEVLCYDFSNRLDLDCHKLHAWWHRHYPTRPMPALYNSWLCRFDRLDADFVLRQVARAKDLGLDYFVLDAGWFGPKADWSVGRGDWEELPDGYLNGRMAEVSAAVRSAGMKFGFWLETESASGGSRVVKEHPEWFVFQDGQYFLDFSRDDARNAITEKTCELVKRYDAGFLKFDFNQNIEFDRTGRAFADYHAGYRKYVEAVRARNPGIYIEGCASGGLRMDLGRARLFDSFWLSDNQSPYQGMRIVKESILRLPPQVIGRWVVARTLQGIQPDYSGRVEGSDSRLAATDDGTWTRICTVARDYVDGFTDCGVLGFSCDLTALADGDFQHFRRNIADRRADDAFWRNAVVRILCDTPDVLVLQYSDEALEDVRVVVVTERTRQTSITFRPALDPSGTYQVQGRSRTAADIAASGVTVGMPANYRAQETRLKKAK